MDQPLTHPVSDIQLTLSSTRALGAPELAGFERWAGTAYVADGEGDLVGLAPVGSVSVLEVDLMACDDPWGALDGSNEEIAYIGGAIFDEMTGQLSEALDSSLARTGSRVLVLDRVELEPPWQGRNVAALLIAETLERMRHDVRVALCLPGPLHRGETSRDQYEESIRRMQQVWAQVGFQPFREGVWLLEPNQGAFGERLEALRERHRVG